jgi:hypothetical protein
MLNSCSAPTLVCYQHTLDGQKILGILEGAGGIMVVSTNTDRSTKPRTKSDHNLHTLGFRSVVDWQHGIEPI